MSIVLTESEIDQLTKPRRQRAAQKRVLERMLGCKLARRPDGLRRLLKKFTICFYAHSVLQKQTPLCGALCHRNQGLVRACLCALWRGGSHEIPRN